MKTGRPASLQLCGVLASAGIGTALVAAVIALYWPVRGFDFVSLDDPGYVFDNPVVRRGLTWDGVRWAFDGFHSSNWHPLIWLSLMLDAQAFGLAPAGFHLVNVALHAANAVLLFLALRLMTGALWPCAFVAALFALHPQRVESVAWVTERKDVLSGLFWMTTLLAYGWYARRPGIARYALVFASLALGLMAKPMMVTLPCVLLLLDLWPLGRWPAGAAEGWSAGSRAPPTAALTLGRLVAEKLPLLALSAASSAVTVLAQRSKGAMSSLEAVPLGARLANAAVTSVAYLLKMLWPADLAVMYPHPALVSPEAAASLVAPAAAAGLLLLAVSITVIRLARRLPYLAVGWFWYLGTLAPVSGIVQVGQQAMADRYTYLPMIGVAIALAWGARDCARRWPRSRVGLAVAAAAALALCAVTSRRQIETWRDSVSLFEQAIAVTRDNYFAHANLATVLVALGRAGDAEAHYQRALQIKPGYPTALTGLGSLYFRQGRFDDAVAQHRRALEAEPDSAMVHSNLGAALYRLGRLDEAAEHLERALALSPDLAMAHSNLGAIYFQQGKFDQATAHFEAALRLNPQSAAAHNNLGVALLRQGRLADAAAEFESALRLQPGLPDAQRNLRDVRARLGAGGP